MARSAGGDRSVTTLIGLLLLAVGVAGALLCWNVFGAARAGRPLLDPMIVDWIRANPLPTRLIAIGTGVLLAVLGLLWAGRSVRPERRPDLGVEAGPDTTVRVDGSAFADAVAARAQDLPGVGRARARMVGTDKVPALRLTLWLSEGADMAGTLHQVSDDVLAEARTSLGLAELPAAIRVELDTHTTTPRVR